MLEHPLLQKADALGLWMRLLMKASTQPARVSLRGKPIDIRRGQVACSVVGEAEAIGITRKRARYILGQFVSDGMLTCGHVEGHVFSLVSICNFDRYQSQDDGQGPKAGPQKGQIRARLGPTDQERENPESYPVVESNLVTSSLIASPVKPARKKRLHPETPGFAVFWQAYPRKVGKLAAEKSFASAIESGVVLAELLEGVRRYVASKPTYQDYCYPATWLNEGRWADEENVGQGQGQLLPRNGAAHKRTRADVMGDLYQSLEDEPQTSDVGGLGKALTSVPFHRRD